MIYDRLVIKHGKVEIEIDSTQWFRGDLVRIRIYSDIIG